jgi:hypothetical protein
MLDISFWLDRPTILAGFATLAGGIGWFATVRTNRSAAKSQHTFDVLLATGFDPLYQAHLKNVRPSVLSDGADVPDIDGVASSDLGDSIIFLLNYYEFLAGALRRGALSEGLLRDDQAYIVKRLFEHSKKQIEEQRHGKQRAALFEHIEWLYGRWNVRKASRFQKIIEWACSKPMF